MDNQRYENALAMFRMLIRAQDLIRNVYCVETGTTYQSLKQLDESLSRSINRFAREKGIVSITNQFDNEDKELSNVK